MLSALLDWVLFAAGLAVVFVVLDAAIRTFVLPRGEFVLFTWVLFRAVRAVLALFARETHSFERRDRVMAFYAPLAMLAFPAVSLVLLLGGFTAMFVAVEDTSFRQGFDLSGSAMLTLGFDTPGDLPGVMLSFSAAMMGLALLALLIAYLPTIYTAFSRREAMVMDLAVRAGTPATAWEMLERAHRAGYLREMDKVWDAWMTWFTEVSETHTSLGALSYFRSPNPHRSWVTASGAVLDAAALRLAVVDIPFTPSAGLCLRSGYLALREIAGYFGYEYEPDPSPDDPISVEQQEFEEVYMRLAEAGVPLKPDVEQAWRDFAGWRVNYDSVLVTLAAMTIAPYGPWTSDRVLRTPLSRRSPLRRANRQSLLLKGVRR